MPKMKTRRAAAKRFTVTGTGEFKRNKAYKRHFGEEIPEAQAQYAQGGADYGGGP